MKKVTKKKVTKKKSDMSSEELAAVAGGSKNIDHPGVRAAIDAFQATVKAAEDAKAARLLELARNSGGSLGPTKANFE